MTETMETAGASVRSGLAAMKLTELKGLAAGLGITGTTKMRKDDLVAVIALSLIHISEPTRPY